MTTDLWDALEAVSGEPVAQDDGHLDPPGRPPRRHRRGRHDQPGAVQLHAEDAPTAAIGSSWLVPVRSRSLRRRREVSRQLLGDEPQPLASAASGARERRRLGRLPHELRAPPSSPPSPARSTTLVELERAVLVNDTWALVLAGRREVRDLARAWRAASATRSSSRTWSTVASALDYLWRAATPDDRRVRRRRRPRASSGRSSRTSAGSRSPARTTGRSRCAGCSSSALGTIGADEAVRAEAARALRRRASSTATSRPRCSRRSRRVNRPGDFDEALARFRAAKDPQSENRYRRALAQFNDDGAHAAVLRDVLRRVPPPRRAPADDLAAREPHRRARRSWEQLAATLGRDQRRCCPPRCCTTS